MLPWYHIWLVPHWIIFLQTMTNFEPLHKLQAHKEYILKCLLSPEFCEPQRQLPRFNIFISLFFFFFILFFYFIKYVSYLHIALFMPNFLPAVRCKLISACITFSRYLATASADHTVKIWNVDGFTLEKTLTGIHQVTTFYCACCFIYMSKIDPVVNFCLHYIFWISSYCVCFCYYWANGDIDFTSPCAFQDINAGYGTVCSQSMAPFL